MIDPRTATRALLLAATLAAFSSCGDDAPTGDGQAARLALRLRVREASEVPARGGRNVTFAYQTATACATEAATRAPGPSICATHQFPPGGVHYQFRLDVPVAPYYAVDVDVIGTRRENGKDSEAGLLFYGRGFARDLAEGTEAPVDVVLDEVVPRLSIDRTSGTIFWPSIVGANQYRVLETRAVGAPREHVVTGTSATLAELRVATSALRVRAELPLGRTSAYSESVQVQVASTGSAVSGRLIDTGQQPVGGALIKLLTCDLVDTGLLAYSGVDGRFLLPDAADGRYRLEIFRAGCADRLYPDSGCFDLLSPDGVDVSAIPLTCASSVWSAITLTWGASPTDLDLHLWTPAIADSAYHVFFAAPGSDTEAPFALLDHDEVNGFGPERITVLQPSSGTYTVAVAHWCDGLGDNTLSNSGAAVRVLKPDGSTTTFEVPNVQDQPFWWWTVCTIDGTTGATTAVGTITAGPPLPSLECNGVVGKPWPR